MVPAGGYSASSSAASALDAQSSIATGGIHVGGFTLNPKSSFDGDLIIKGAAVVALGLGALWAFKKLR